MMSDRNASGGREERDEQRLRSLLEAGTDIAGGTAGALIGLGLGGPIGVVAEGAGGPALARTALYLASEIKRRMLSKREEQRIGAAIIFAGEKIRENRESGQQVRQDDFFREQPDDRAAAEEIFESVLLAAQREPQEKKLRYYGTLVANIAFHPEISREQANLLTKLAENLSYQQLCLLAVFANNDRWGQSLRQDSYNDGGLSSDDEIAAVQEAYELYSQSLVNCGGDALIGLTHVIPSQMQTQGFGSTLYALMELWEINSYDLDRVIQLLQ